METEPVVNNAAAKRFEIRVEGQVAYLDYRLNNGCITLVHTTVPPALEGRGIGSRLAKTGLEHARTSGLSVIAQCRFVRGYLERHPEYQDLIKQ